MNKILPIILILTAMGCSKPKPDGTPMTLEFRAASEENMDGYEKFVDKSTGQEFYLSPTIALSNQDIKSAKPGSQKTSHPPFVALTFTPAGKKAFETFTEANVAKHIGILLNGELVSTPRVLEPIVGGKAQLTGNYTEAEIEQIAAGIMATQP